MIVRNTLRAKVAGAQQQDVGKGIVRLGPRAMRSLAIEKGDIVQVTGARTTAAIAIPTQTHAHEDGADVIRMDGLIRSNSRIGIGGFVEVSKAEWSEAKKVVLAPARPGLLLSGSGEALRPTLLYRPLVQGDLISTSVFRQAQQALPGDLNDVFRAFLQSPPFGLMEIRLVVVSTAPRGIVRVTDETEIELVPEHRTVEERPPIDATYEDLGGLKPIIQKVREMIELPLQHPELFDRLGIEPPKGILLHGPPGTGKTLLARAVAYESHAHFTSINGPEIMGKFFGESEERLRQIFAEAEENKPAIIFIDELDSIAPRRAEVSGEVERRIVAQLLALMDGLKSRRNIIVIGATNRLEAIDPALRRPGRFDREVLIGIPDQEGRLEILQIHTRGMPLGRGVDLKKMAEVTHGYTGSDLAALTKEAALAALRRIMPGLNLEEKSIPKEVLEKLTVDPADFDTGLREVQPSALREIVVEIPSVRWEDVGGLEPVKSLLRERVELPLRRPDAFARLGIKAPKGVLLYGPPGTGKTLLAKAVATEARANFITAKGSALLSKWYGESEKKISEVFQRARQVTPAILFFDELDSLAPARGGSMGDPHVTERVVNQLLAEMDGMEELRGVIVLGASNRPDMIDPALLRPGRFDELVPVPVPDRASRQAIFQTHLRKMAVAADVDPKRLAELTEHFTGADIAGVCTKAGLNALRESIEARVVTMEHVMEAIKDTLPSVTDEMEREYEKLGERLRQEPMRIGFLRAG